MTTTTINATLDAIQSFVASKYAVTQQELIEPRKPWFIVEARQVMHYLARQACPMRDADIADHYNRERTIIPYSARCVRDRMDVYPQFRDHVQKLENELKRVLKNNKPNP